MKWWFQEKLNPIQPAIAIAEGDAVSSRENPVSYRNQYETLEVVNRAVNMIVDDVSEVKLKVGDKLKGIDPVGRSGSIDNGRIVPIFRKQQISDLINIQPNPYQDVNTFKSNLLVDYLIDGNAFIYFDGAYLYQLPAVNTAIVPHKTEYVKEYVYSSDGTDTRFLPHEIIHIKENSLNSVYRGTSRLRPAYRTMVLLGKMRKFQENFFDNGAVPGLVIKSPNTLSDKVKERMLQTWVTRYRPDAGGRRPIILDGGIEIDAISNVTFQEMDFQNSVTALENIILKAIGIPPLLLDSGNNANIRPNHRLYYLETVVPILHKFVYAYQRYFGFEIWEDVTDTQALQPELADQAGYYASLVNNGIITPNEARIDLGRASMPGQDELRVPQNIAGSATDPSIGGKPPSASNG